MIHSDVIILGGGAAGLMCAIEAGKRGRRVVVLERSDRCGKKILISGGGRCNFTNIHCTAENFLSANPHFAKSALSRYTPSDFLALVKKHNIPYHEKTLGQLFCDRSAHDILNTLLAECRAVGVDIKTGATVREVEKASDFTVRTNTADFRAPALVIATGGLSIPKAGATSFGYDVARQFGIKTQPTRPALVPFLLDDQDRKRYCDLAGVSTEVVALCDGGQFREKMLITHRGLSGPAILQISSYWNRQPVTIDLAPGRDVTAAFQDKKSPRNLTALRSALHEFLPVRLANRWLENTPQLSFTNRGLQEFDRKLHNWEVTPSGTEGYSKAEVTAGGVDVDELSAKTMESRKVPGLFFIGEVVDVTGQLGGFNYQWAWASGFCAGQAV